MAKGTEDTAFYRYARFIALNEVGADAGEFGIGLDDFHALQQVRQAAAAAVDDVAVHPRHQARRGRPRPAGGAGRGRRGVGALRRRVPGAVRRSPTAPSPTSWPRPWSGSGPVEDRERLHAYAEKAMREASQETGWTSVDDGVREHRPGGDRPRVRRRRAAGLPGSGCWPWSSSPAGRTPSARSWSSSPCPGSRTSTRAPSCGRTRWSTRTTGEPVDFGRAARSARLAERARRRWTRRARPSSGSPPAHSASAATGPSSSARYAPVPVSGPAAAHAIAYDRGGAITVATRLPIGLARAGGWGDTVLELDGSWTDVLTGRPYAGPVRLADLLDQPPRSPPHPLTPPRPPTSHRLRGSRPRTRPPLRTISVISAPSRHGANSP